MSEGSELRPVVTAPADQTANEGASTSFLLGSFTDPGADTWTHLVSCGANGTLSDDEHVQCQIYRRLFEEQGRRLARIQPPWSWWN